ncbi:multiple epidermal growth factor-like domains protein 10 [Haliotis rubra]|uniref:multiple epidermal growth factor-like domains protein 10 n=1 Tax=Haliotis rubra TaxID=36100 RepID=UPI001EE592AA|nr:multiple epidermal growth factor-like domains protein 10 [Haliotis rubra]
MRHHSVLVLTMCGLALTQWTVAGFPSCQDNSPDYYCRSISCKQPGSGELCQKTCGLCPEDCRSGYFKDGSSCGKCKDGVDVQSDDYRRKCDVPCNHSNTWGADCRTRCSEGCRNQTCHRWRGHCLQNCKPGYYGSTCELHCDGCRSCGDRGDTCDNEGRCLCGCMRGKRGDKCDQDCLHCEMCSGNNCTCQEGFRGALCRETCVNCKSCNVANCICQDRGASSETCVNSARTNFVTVTEPVKDVSPDSMETVAGPHAALTVVTRHVTGVELVDPAELGTLGTRVSDSAAPTV